MTNLFDNGGECLKLTVMNLGTLEGGNQGDVHLEVSVQSGDFAGKNPEVWISKPEW